MCGIVGIYANNPINQTLYDALTVLQHRGQDAAGIMTCHDNRFHLRKDNGLVRDVFHTRHMKSLPGNIGIGHVRYPTAGSSSSAEAQPFYVNSPYGIALAHNGNLTNADTIKDDLFRSELRHINTSSDSEILLNVFAHELHKLGQLDPLPEHFFTAVDKVYKRCQGGYAVIALINGHGLLGFRDPHGIRPLIYGRRQSDSGYEYMFASESVALRALGFEPIRDVLPGEAVLIDSEGRVHSQMCSDTSELTPCIFEFVYFARPDSIIDGISVYKSRLRMGQKLAEKLKREWGEHDIDVVMPIPDSSRPSAMEMANVLGVNYREGFVKNRYIGRTFIMPGQTMRKKSVKQKLNAIELEFKGKNVMLVDDSIVRGTTCSQIIEMAREAGAKKVYFCSAAPAVRFPNVYGIDMPVAQELIAYGRTDEEVASLIGADRLIYQDLPDLIDSVQAGNTNIKTFDCSVFDGKYLTGHVDEAYLNQLAMARNDSAKAVSNESVLDLHNESA
ncbi:amidophosphoribosyltransferase [Sansalvadorimonas sp. 2012CJ34-2]|uniref:Amidophosphoribosyltransferase n=1 Tax=Parendozoicomonas callyspongiae TaxID=2942213 RepID=A0ABT0PBV0_9GAMM|nr:amidophosphoribosyltransferase [Sansalvadorimonas sp. 2012CJ34-2]MCL6268696.1 amidophosphoribosyltransferase [Sansalvadorimonas sp. 2012CJ34-2]